LGVSPKPPRAPNCQHLSSASAPAITSPKRGVEYQVLAGSTLELRAHSDASVRRLYWFANGAYLGASAAGAPLIWSPNVRGRIGLSVIDDQGGQDVRELRFKSS